MEQIEGDTMDAPSSDAGHDEYGVSYDDYPDCDHREELDIGERCQQCVPPAIRQQRLIDADPEGYERAVEAMLEAAKAQEDESTWRAEP